MQQIKNSSKLMGCSIHGHIRVSHLALRIIDTPEFQRLRHIKQLGLCNYVYPSAVHTRFEHSIGVYHLAGKMVEKLQKNYPNLIYDIPDLGKTILTDHIGELIKIGGLCHDIGHGPYSHLFDEIMEKKTGHENAHHEVRSCKIIEMICEKYLQNELTSSHVRFIQSIVNPGPNHNGALYQIVANNLNGIDVDKFDYLARDSKVLGLNKGFDPRKLIDEIAIDTNGNIAYAKHCSTEIYDMFHTRYMMHKMVYNHKTTKIIEEMISDIINKIEPIIKLSDYIYDMNKFCKLTDYTIPSLLEYHVDNQFDLISVINNPNFDIIKQAHTLYQNIINRKLYKCIIDVPDKQILENIISSPLGSGVKNEERIRDPNIKDEDIKLSLTIISISIGYVSGNKKNPFDSIFFYDKKEIVFNNDLNKSTDGSLTASFILDKNYISVMLNNEYTENHNFLLCKCPSYYDDVKRWFK